jgi:hypothetical protein
MVGIMLAAPSDLAEAMHNAQYGTRMPGDTIAMTGLKRADGQVFSFQALPHRVRVVLFVEPLQLPEGLQRLAWWRTNAKSLGSLADLILVPSASPMTKADLGGLVLVDDSDCLLAARFGSIRPYDGRLGALPMAFVLDDHGIIRATVEPGPAAEQLQTLRTAVKRLRHQLSRQAQNY